MDGMDSDRSTCSGAWLVVPTYMVYALGSEIIDAGVIASKATGSAKDE